MRSNNLKLITNLFFFHFDLIDALLVIWKVLLIVWQLVTYGEEIRDKRLNQVFTAAAKTRFAKSE